ncbi:LOW QUALITY PROTEIN: conserved hypothetical protein, partial [Mycobacterium tuberculosis T92]
MTIDPDQIRARQSPPTSSLPDQTMSRHGQSLAQTLRYPNLVFPRRTTVLLAAPGVGGEGL